MAVVITEILTEIGMKIDSDCFIQTDDNHNGNRQSLFHDDDSTDDLCYRFSRLKRQSMFHDVDYRVRVTEIDSLITAAR